MKPAALYLAPFLLLASYADAGQGRIISPSEGLVFTGRATKPLTFTPDAGLVFHGNRVRFDVSGYWKPTFDGAGRGIAIGAVQENGRVAMDLVTCETGAAITACPPNSVLNLGPVFQGRFENSVLKGTWTPYCTGLMGNAEGSTLNFPVNLRKPEGGGGASAVSRLEGTSEVLPGEEVCDGAAPFDDIVLSRIGELPEPMTLTNRFAFGCVAGDFGQDRSVAVAPNECGSAGSGNNSMVGEDSGIDPLGGGDSGIGLLGGEDSGVDALGGADLTND